VLTMLEEVVLLAVDERNGGLRSTREYSTAYALVGAVVFDLALAKRIDTDTEEVLILDTAPTGNATGRCFAGASNASRLGTEPLWRYGAVAYSAVSGAVRTHSTPMCKTSGAAQSSGERITGTSIPFDPIVGGISIWMSGSVAMPPARASSCSSPWARPSPSASKGNSMLDV